MKNPFFYRNKIEDIEYFIDREDIIKKILFEDKNFILTGGLKLGKSSTLYILTKEAILKRYKLNPKEYILIYLNLKDTKIKPSSFNELLINEIKKKELISREEERLLREDLSGIAYKFKYNGIKLKFLLDDFWGLGDLATSAEIKKILTLPTLNFVISLPYHLLSEYHLPNYEIIYMGLFTEEETKELILKLSAFGNLSLKEDINFILDTAGTHPFFVTILCYYLFEAKGRKQTLTDKDYSFIKEQFLKDSTTYFYHIWDNLTKEEKAGLFDIIQAKQINKELLRSLYNNALLKSDGSIYSVSFSKFVEDRLKEELSSALEFVFKSEEDIRSTQEIILSKDKAEIFNTARVLVKSVESKDKYTKGHADRVAKYAEYIAKELELENIGLIKMAGRLHDIGKIGIDKLILLKPEPLSEYEFSIIKQHPIIGAYILEALGFPFEIIPIVRHHHERMDGSGYPDGLAGESIPFGARILAVADVFDAMISDRAYRPARPLYEAVEELKSNAGIKYDERVVVTFLKLIEREGLLLLEEK